MTVAWVFPGQGSQVVGMGRELYERYPAARAVFEDADCLLGFKLTTLCFEGPADLLTQTENAQPALLTVSAALLAVMGACTHTALPRPVLLAGHSLGEFSALYAAGALDFPTALRLVRRRGELMAAAHEGSMAAVLGLPLDQLTSVCNEASAQGPVVIANENAPGQVVISGATAAVMLAGDLAKRAGAKRVLPLQVSAAFHSPLMHAAACELATVIRSATIRPAHPLVVGNVHATPLCEPEALRAELIAQVTAPVRWIASVEYMQAQGIDTVVEIGPGNVLTGLIKRIVPGFTLHNVADGAAIEKLCARV
ncbi:MAG: ACP S-malonyltransferase [Herpetosiphonaceae bacterium]|nr:ACP S-malonyltransferase [Herpetosiphonaceae bacterium]